MKPFAKLRGRIVEKFGSQREFAKALGTSEQTVVAKLSGRTQFSQEDIIQWCDLLDIQLDEIGAYFFAERL